MTLISDFKKELQAKFLMDGRGRVHWFLGLRNRREGGKVTVDLERYIEKLLEQFQMDQCKPSRTSVDLSSKLQTAENRDEEKDQRIYRNLVGLLLHLLKQTRQGIVFTVKNVSRHMKAHTKQHWLRRKRLLGYVQCSQI